MELGSALRTLSLISLGLYSHYWLLLHVSGFRSSSSALLCMLVTRSLLAHPYLHVNIFQVRSPWAQVLGMPTWTPAEALRWAEAAAWDGAGGIDLMKDAQHALLVPFPPARRASDHSCH